MLLGKRPQPPVMKRTTSMNGGMALDVPHDHGDGDDGIKDDPHHHRHDVMGHDHGLMAMVHKSTNNNVFSSTELHDEFNEPLLGMFVSSPNSHISTNMVNHHHLAIQTPQFLRTCGLCKCRLAPGRDIYMYRGDTAFCSLECREQRMKEDSRKEKWNKMTSNKENHRGSPSPAAAAADSTASTRSKAAACT